MEEQLGVEDVPPAEGAIEAAAPGAAEKDASTLDQQRASLCNSDSSPALAATPTPAVPDSHFTDETVRVGGGEVGPTGETEPHTDAGPEGLRGDQLTDSSSQEGAVPVTPPLESLPHETGPQIEVGDSMDVGLPGAGQGVTEKGDTPTAGAEDSGGAEEGRGPSVGGYMSQLYAERLEMGLGEEIEKDRKKAVGANGPEEFREGEEEAGLDDLARRIQVEEITPAAGLVSILKRRSSLEGAPPRPPAPPKQVPKRKVRFREPEEAVDHDEVGGDSWLLLLLLCLATVVISVGGTALYCTLGNAQSSVCTDFSRNVDFYFSQVQRGIEELRQWLSPGS
ncbi:consortin-like [Megalops cyprinoides]|uniref:consortin-like n=1 Tax=Megalops cyprinoides TaxID=118141 RepID=UPI001863BB08|nr:consortin-like [Megalops cyprinoides]